MCGNRRSRLQGKNGGMAAGKTCGDDEQFDLAAWFPSLEWRAGHTGQLLPCPDRGIAIVAALFCVPIAEVVCR